VAVLLLALGFADTWLSLLPSGIAELAFALAAALIGAASWPHSTALRRFLLLAVPTALSITAILILTRLTHRSLLTAVLTLACLAAISVTRPRASAT
jgi:hypothetical protein